MEIFTVSFFGHRKVSQFSLVEERLEAVIQRLLEEKEYVEFLVGRSGEFDQLASSAVRRTYECLFCRVQFKHTLIHVFQK